MGVVFSPDTEYAKEMRKWNAHHSEFGAPGRPYRFMEFPKRLSKAERNAAGKIVIVDAQTANDEHEERNLLSRGFCEGQDKAIEAVEKEQTVHGTLAAEREFAIRHGRHSAGAVSEIRAAEDSAGMRHLPDVPEKPIRRRGRRPKAETAAA